MERSELKKLKSVNTAIGAASIGNGVKKEIIKTALEGNKGSGISKYLKFSKGFGTVIGLASASITYNEYRTEKINTTEFVIEATSSVFSSLIPGWGIGWEGGRIVTKIPGYHENLRAPTRKWIEKTFGITPWK